MVQAVWSTAHGRPLEVTNGATGEQMVRLGSHVDPILAALAPLWIVSPSPLTLVAVQIVGGRARRAPGLLARSAAPRFGAGCRRCSRSTYLAYPWIAWTAVDAFHPVTLAIPLFLFCVWFLDTDRLVAVRALRRPRRRDRAS